MARIANFTSAGTPVGPTNGLTLDALLLRQKELADRQTAIQAPRQMISPWQGAAQLAQSFVNARQEASTADQLAAGRQQLAAIRAGIDLDKGPTSEQISQASLLDPGYADNLTQMAAQAIQARRAQDLAIANREDTQSFQAGQQVNQQDFTRGENEAARQAAIEAAKLKAAEPNSPEGKIMSDFNAGRYGDPTSPEAIALRDAAIKKETQPSGVGGPANLKVLYDQQDQYIGTSSAIGQLARAKELLDQGINTGYSSGVRTMAGNAGLTGDAEKAAADRTKEYNSIMTGQAITAMSQALKGATTDTEMARFIEIMNDPTIDPVIKGRQIETMMAKARAFNEQQGMRIKAMDPNAELPAVGPAKLDPAAEEELLAGARAAISKGADAALVKKRLVDKGADPGKL